MPRIVYEAEGKTSNSAISADRKQIATDADGKFRIAAVLRGGGENFDIVRRVGGDGSGTAAATKYRSQEKRSSKNILKTACHNKYRPCVSDTLIIGDQAKDYHIKKSLFFQKLFRKTFRGCLDLFFIIRASKQRREVFLYERKAKMSDDNGSLL